MPSTGVGLLFIGQCNRERGLKLYPRPTLRSQLCHQLCIFAQYKSLDPSGLAEGRKDTAYSDTHSSHPPGYNLHDSIAIIHGGSNSSIPPQPPAELMVATWTHRLDDETNSTRSFPPWTSQKESWQSSDMFRMASGMAIISIHSCSLVLHASQAK